ncbi:MAG: recombinase RecT [Methylococcaceae bacterium]
MEQVFEDGWLSEKVTFKPNVSERELHAQDEDWVFKNLRLVIANARRNVSSGKVETASVSMTKAMIEHRRVNFSQAQRAGKYTKPEDKNRLSAGLPIGIWQEHYTAMAIKTVLGAIGKKLPKTSRMEHALKFLSAESEDEQAITNAAASSIDADSYIVEESAKNEVAELTVIPDNSIKWDLSIKECGDRESLMHLLDDMSEDEKIDYSYLIDAQFDSFPDGDQQGDKSLEIDPYADLRLVIEESESLSEIANLLKEMKQPAKVALAGVIRKRQDEIKARQAA